MQWSRYLKVTTYIWLFVVFSSFNKSQAIVVAPIIIVSILKLTVFLAGIISPPIITLFQIIEKRNRLKAILKALLIILIICGLFFLVVSIYNKINPSFLFGIKLQCNPNASA